MSLQYSLMDFGHFSDDRNGRVFAEVQRQIAECVLDLMRRIEQDRQHMNARHTLQQTAHQQTGQTGTRQTSEHLSQASKRRTG
jgi:hypothetical protein